MKTLFFLPFVLLLFFSHPGDTGPGKVGDGQSSSGDTLTIQQDSLQERWWTTIKPSTGILPQADTSNHHVQKPVAFACANESGMTSSFFIYDESPPKFINREEIMEIMVYPKLLKQHRIEGRVLVDANVDYTGKVIGFEITFGTHSLMKMAVMDVVFDMKFQPARQAGRAVDSWVTVPIWFEMSDVRHGE